MSEELFGKRDAAVKLGISERTVSTLVKKGDLSGFQVGNKWKFRQSDLDDYENRQRRKAIGGHPPIASLECSVA